MFIVCFPVLYLCYNGNGRILVYWSHDNVLFINNTLSTIATGYICSYIFYVLTVLWPKAERSVPILEMAKEDIRYAKDTIGGFFMENNGLNDVKAMSDFQIIQCLTTPLKNKTSMLYSIAKKETEWLQLLEKTKLVKTYLQFVKSESEYLNLDNLNRIKAIEDCFHTILYRT